MPKQLAGWVCVLMAGAVMAGDKPKDKTLPSTSTREMLKAEVRAEAQAEMTAKFTVSKPVGTWTREAKCEGADCQFLLTLTDDRLTLTVHVNSGKQTAVVRIDADYSINKESCLYGVIDSFDEGDAGRAEANGGLVLPGQPFSVRFRVEDGVLILKDFKGMGVGLGEVRKDVRTILAAVCGRYTGVDPSKPLLPMKTAKKTEYSSDPLIRQDQLLNQSEDLRQIGEVWRRFWFGDPADPKAPRRIHGGILKAEPPSTDDGVKQAKAEETVAEPTRILPPLRAGECGECDPPTDAAVLKLLGEKAKGFDGTITVVKTNLVDKLDPARLFPIVGQARLHHCHWECRVYFVKDLKVEKPAVEVVYVDTDALRLASAEQIVVPKQMPEK